LANPKKKAVYVCQSCGNDSPRWEGRCPSCHEWNTLVEFDAGRPSANLRRLADAPAPFQELAAVSVENITRLSLASPEVNRVLGGGLVPGSVVLVAGDPGIGKSTLLLQVGNDVAASTGDTLYVSGEESMSQIKVRADRLHLAGERLHLLQTTDLDDITTHLDRMKPALAIVDSIQTVHDSSVNSPAGSPRKGRLEFH
jgi:DNA repair protein RadA/Sms